MCARQGSRRGSGGVAHDGAQLESWQRVSSEPGVCRSGAQAPLVYTAQCRCKFLSNEPMSASHMHPRRTKTGRRARVESSSHQGGPGVRLRRLTRRRQEKARGGSQPLPTHALDRHWLPACQPRAALLKAAREGRSRAFREEASQRRAVGRRSLSRGRVASFGGHGSGLTRSDCGGCGGGALAAGVEWWAAGLGDGHAIDAPA